MPEEPYKNREIREMFEDVKQSLGRLEKGMGEVKTQTTLTNGRVLKLEAWQESATSNIFDLKKEVYELSLDYAVNKTRLWTSVAVMLFLGGAIITLAIMAIDAKIQDGLHRALSEYEVQIQ
jgi:hypothetical protein